MVQRPCSRNTNYGPWPQYYNYIPCDNLIISQCIPIVYGNTATWYQNNPWISIIIAIVATGLIVFVAW